MSVLKDRTKARERILRRVRNTLLLAGISLLFPFLLILLLYLSDRERLQYNEPISADILVAEGWMPAAGMELAREEYLRGNYRLLLTTGVRSSDYYSLYSKGNFIFSTSGMTDSIEKDHSLQIGLYSELGGQHRALFSILLNDSLAMRDFAGKRKTAYRLNWYGALSDLDSVTVRFENDLFNEKKDRNLHISGIRINGEHEFTYDQNTAYIRTSGSRSERDTAIYAGYSGIGRMKLIAAGMDPGEVFPLESKRLVRNRTLSNALDLYNWYLEQEEQPSINILSYGHHAKRTHYIYSTVFGENADIGMISLPVTEEYYHKREMMLVFKEYLSLAYYRVLFLFFRTDDHVPASRNF